MQTLQWREDGYPHDTGGSEAMPLITLSVQQEHTFDEACTRFETVVHELCRKVAFSRF
jgi:hypothetical protein